MEGLHRGSPYPTMSYLLCGQVIPCHRLHRLELKIVGLYPNSLNRIQHSVSPYKAVPAGGQASVCVGVGNDVHVARRTKPSNCRVEMRVQVADADGAVLSVTDLNEAIALCTAVPWHASYPWTASQSTRQFGGSVVILYDGKGNSFVGLLKAAVGIARTWGAEQRYLSMIQRLDPKMNRDCDYLLALCRSEIPKYEACDLLGQ